MKKNYIALLLFIFISANLFAQENINIYNLAKSSVVYLQHEIYFDPTLCENVNIIERLEKYLDDEVLDEYYVLASGSGFFIDESGLILTNRHVIQIPDIRQMRNSIAKELISELKDRFEGIIADEDLNKAIDDLKRMISQGVYRFTATVNGEVYNDISIICVAENDYPDLALLKVNSNSDFAALRILNNSKISHDIVGTDVSSLGFPIGTALDRLFEDRVVTMNRGSISAVRESDLNIQHTAAISHGNSGGPLVNSTGEVIGINTALLEEANSLYYAVGVDHIYSFLIENGFSDILKWNSRILYKNENIDDGVKYNTLGEIEISADLIVNAQKGAEVYINDEFKGLAPLFLYIEQPESILRIVCEGSEFSSQLRVLRTLSGTTTIEPKVAKDVITVEIIGSAGAEVYADGRFIGRAPLEIELPADDYQFNFKKAEYYFEPINYKFDSKNNVTLEINEIPAQLIRLRNLQIPLKSNLMDFIQGDVLLADENRVEFSFKSGDRLVRRSLSDSIYLPDGVWEMTIFGIPEYQDLLAEFTITGKTTEIDLNNFKPEGLLTIRNFPENAEIWVDGMKLSDLSVSPLSLPLGLRNIYIWKNGTLPLSLDINIKQTDDAYITWQDISGHDVNATSIAAVGLITTGIGTGMIILSGLFGLNDFAVQNSSNYGEYDLLRKLGLISSITGSGFIVGGLLTAIPFFQEVELYNKDLIAKEEMAGSKK